MDKSINELFSVILQSEQIAFDEKKKLHEVKEQIELVRSRLKKQANSITEITTQIQQMTQGWAGATVNLDLLRMREEWYSRMLKSLQDELHANHKKLATLKAEYEKSSLMFMSVVSEFSQHHGLGSRDRERKEAEVEISIQHFTSEIQSLEQGIRGLQTENAELTGLLSYKAEMIEMMDRADRHRLDLERSIEEEDTQISHLLDQQKKLQAMPDTDQEFIRLNSEYQQNETNHLEIRLAGLQDELCQMTTQVERRQNQQHRQQYRDWQRHRMLQHNKQQQHQLHTNHKQDEYRTTEG